MEIEKQTIVQDKGTGNANFSFKKWAQKAHAKIINCLRNIGGHFNTYIENQ